jgi:phosphoribosylanthranilate isomerase
MPYVKIIKVFPIGNSLPTQTIHSFNNVCDYFLFDTACTNYGGSGKTFDWQILNAVSIDKPFFISGGINPQNYKDVKKLPFKNILGLDLNSGFELSPGIKDIEKINQTINQTHANGEKE